MVKLSVTDWKNSEELYAGKIVGYNHLESVRQPGKQSFRRKISYQSYPCLNHTLHPEKTYFFQVMLVSSCLFDGCTQFGIKKSDL